MENHIMPKNSVHTTSDEHALRHLTSLRSVHSGLASQHNSDAALAAEETYERLMSLVESDEAYTRAAAALWLASVRRS